MKSRIWQPVILPTPLKPPKNHVFHNSRIACQRIPPPVNWMIKFDGVERFRKYWKTLKSEGIRKLNTMVDNIVEDYLRERVLEIPLETITKDDLEIVVEGEILISVSDPLLASSFGDNKHLISALTQLLQTTFPYWLNKQATSPFGNLMEDIVSAPGFHQLKDTYDDGCRKYESDGIPDFRMFKNFGYVCDNIFKHPGYPFYAGNIKKITVPWGVKCWYFKIRFHMPSEEAPTWEDVKVFLSFLIFRNKVNGERLYKLLRRKGDRIMKAMQVLRDHYKGFGGKDGYDSCWSRNLQSHSYQIKD